MTDEYKYSIEHRLRMALSNAEVSFKSHAMTKTSDQLNTESQDIINGQAYFCNVKKKVSYDMDRFDKWKPMTDEDRVSMTEMQRKRDENWRKNRLETKEILGRSKRKNKMSGVVA